VNFVSESVAPAGAPSTRSAFEIPDVFGLRVFRRLGFDGVIRIAVAACLVANIVAMITIIQPYLGNPTAIGTDNSNYYAAGLRLNAGHPLYRLSPGDRPVPLLPPPASDAALLSPPLLAVVWRPLALLGDASMVLWGIAGAALLGGLALWMVLTGSKRRNAVIFLAAPAIALAMWSGNVNPFIISLLIGVWAASARGRPGIAGALLALAAGLKLTPIYLAWWFVVRRDWRALRAFVITGVALAAVSLIGAGLTNHLDYLAVIRTTASSGTTPLSLAGVLQSAGVPSQIASVASLAWVVAGATIMWLLRKQPGAAFSVGILTVLFSSPVVLLGNLAVLLAATAPYGMSPTRRPVATGQPSIVSTATVAA